MDTGEVGVAERDPHTRAVRALTRFPTGSVVSLVIVALLGLVLAVVVGTPTGEVVGREGGPTRMVGLVIGVVVVIEALVVLAVLLRAWRRDVLAAGLIAGDRPEAACGGRVRPGGSFLGLVILGAAFVITAGSLGLLVVVMQVEATPTGWFLVMWLGGALLTAPVLIGWRGGEYLGVHHDGLRVVRGGRLTRGPWSRARVRQGRFAGLEGGPDGVRVTYEIGEVIERRSARALRGRLGTLSHDDAIALGPVRIEQQALVIKGRRVPWQEVADVTFDRDAESGLVSMTVIGPDGRKRGSVLVVDIPSFPVLAKAVRQRTGLSVKEP